MSTCLLVTPEERDIIEKNHFIILEKSILAQTSYPHHWHDYFELEILIDGRATHCMNENNYTLKHGDAYILSYLDSHSFKADEDIKILNIRFTKELLPDKISDFIITANNLHCRFNADELEYLYKKIKSVSNNTDNFIFHREFAANVITEIILLIIKKCSPESPAVLPTPVQKTIAYILTNFRNDISIESAATMLALTPKYLGTLFRKSTNASFHTYLNNIRLKYACILLTGSDISVKEAAYASGYNSVEHFIYTFKKYLDMSPAEYRRKICDE